MKSIKESQLAAELKHSILPLYLICGDDVYTSDKSTALILAALKKADADEPLKYDYSSMTDEDFDSLTYNMSFFGERRTAIIDNFKPGKPSEQRKKLLEEFFRGLPNDLTVILKYVDTGSNRFSIPKTVSELVGLCRDSMTVNCIAAQINIRREIVSMAKDEGCDITDKAVTALVDRLGNDLQTIHTEIWKLSAASNYTEINEDHVKTLSPRNLEDNVFSMINAIESGRTARALTLTEDLLDARVDPLGILGLVNTTYVNYYRCALAAKEGKSLDWLTENFGYKKGDRMLAVASDKCRNYSIGTLEKIIKILYGLDKDLKSSRVDREVILEQGIMNLVLAVKNQ